MRSHFIMNGICIRFKGWIDIDRLDGVGSVEYDEERGRVEEAILHDQLEFLRTSMNGTTKSTKVNQP